MSIVVYERMNLSSAINVLTTVANTDELLDAVRRVPGASPVVFQHIDTVRPIATTEDTYCVYAFTIGPAEEEVLGLANQESGKFAFSLTYPMSVGMSDALAKLACHDWVRLIDFTTGVAHGGLNYCRVFALTGIAYDWVHRDDNTEPTAEPTAKQEAPGETA